VLMALRGNKVLNQVKGQKKTYLQKLSNIFTPKGITHKKILKLMKAILSYKSIIRGYLKPINTIPS